MKVSRGWTRKDGYISVIHGFARGWTRKHGYILVIHGFARDPTQKHGYRSIIHVLYFLNRKPVRKPSSFLPNATYSNKMYAKRRPHLEAASFKRLYSFSRLALKAWSSAASIKRKAWSISSWPSGLPVFAKAKPFLRKQTHKCR